MMTSTARTLSKKKKAPSSPDAAMDTTTTQTAIATTGIKSNKRKLDGSSLSLVLENRTNNSNSYSTSTSTTASPVSKKRRRRSNKLPVSASSKSTSSTCITAKAEAGPDDAYANTNENAFAYDKDSSCNLLIEKIDGTISNSKRLLALSPTTDNNSNDVVLEKRIPFDYSTLIGNNIRKSNNVLNNYCVGKMNTKEVQMWTSSFGATYAAKSCIPSNVCRKLGTITRTLLLPTNTVVEIQNKPTILKIKKMDNMKQVSSPKSIKPPTLPQARKEARRIITNSSNSHHNKNNNYDEKEEADAIEEMAKQIINDWKVAFGKNKKIVPNWNSCGEIQNDDNDSTNNSTFSSIVAIRKMMQKGGGNGGWLEIDSTKNATKNLYHLNIPIDTLTVLKAIEDLAKPDPKLYGVPFLVAIPILEPITKKYNNTDYFKTDNKTHSPCKLTIVIYVHRLLFESMTAESLRTVMAALDEDDNTIIRPLVESPANGPIVFGKDPNTTVEMNYLVDDDNDNDNDNDVAMLKSDNNDENQQKTRMDDTLDAFSIDGFMKLCENQGVSNVDTIYKHVIQPRLYGNSVGLSQSQSRRRRQPSHPRPPCIKVSLLKCQEHAVCWMYQMENLDKDNNLDNNDDNNNVVVDDSDGANNNLSLGLNGLLWERRAFHERDTYYYSPALGQARLTIGENSFEGGKGKKKQTQQSGLQQQQQRQRQRLRSSNRIVNTGGILADEMGIGKTVEAVALIVATLDELKNQKSDKKFMFEDDGCTTYHPATLVIVPPPLIYQWINEIKKIAGEGIVVQFLDHKKEPTKKEDNASPAHGLSLNPDADIVIMTYQALDSSKNNGGASKNSGDGNRVKKSRSSRALAVSKILNSTFFGRIILDEMQEVRSWTTSISKQCELLQSNRRWMLSGTPIFDGVKDFRGELCFLGLEPFAANNEDGYFDFAITNHWGTRSKYGLDILRFLSLVMLRRTKSMHIIETGMPLLGLKNLTLTFEPIQQDPPERALYCFLESAMHTIHNKSNANYTDQVLQKNKQQNLTFLRLLRELCVSPYLINGGLGCSSQLTALNNLMKEYTRRKLQQTDNEGCRTNNSSTGTYSCDEAIQFLSQVQDIAKTDSGFVTDARVGGNGGVSGIHRASDAKQRLEEARKTMEQSKAFCSNAESTRAWAHWHRFVEKITTGRCDESCYDGVALRNPNIRSLWEWRKNMICSKDTNIETIYSKDKNGYYITQNSLLKRGWRPTNKKFFDLDAGDIAKQTKSDDKREKKLKIMHALHPDFRWAHPYAFLFSNIPKEIDADDLAGSFDELLPLNHVEILKLKESKDSETWSAVAHLLTKEDFKKFKKEVMKDKGVQLKTGKKIPHIEQEKQRLEEAKKTAEALCDVYPSESNEKDRKAAEAAYKNAKSLGIRALSINRPNQILCSLMFGDFRDTTKSDTEKTKTSALLHKICDENIAVSALTLCEHRPRIENAKITVGQLQNKIGVSTKVSDLNTFEDLLELKNGNSKNTVCPVCRSGLGSCEGSDGQVLLTRCGHMACKSCLKRWMQGKQECIDCRKPIVESQLICVDPKKVDNNFGKRKKKAKRQLQEAAAMLKENFGELEPYLWEALYFNIDLPTNISQELHQKCTAIPGLFLGHLRLAMGGVPLHSSSNETVAKGTSKYSSKLRALLADLPRDELSVVFASSKSMIIHTQNVLEIESFGCKRLFVGQTEKESECAISEWENTKNNFTVLLVQAGAGMCW